MCSGTETDVGYACPIIGVVARSIARLCPVAYFVVLVTCSGQVVDKQVVHLALGFFVTWRDAHAMDGCAFLNHEARGRDVLDIKGEDGIDVMQKVVDGLVRKTVHKVYADVAYAS